MNPGKPADSGASGPLDPQEERRRRIFGECIDRLNAGEVLDASEIRAAHPEFAGELIERLKDFGAFGSNAGKPAIPNVFGNYRIDRELGRGGMGVVYEAFETAMERRVALKVLSAGLLINEKSVERFRREARIAGKLSHPSIVAVHAMGIEDRTPYIAMEFVEGETLEKVLERKRPRSPEARPPGFLARMTASLRAAPAPGNAAATPDQDTAAVAPPSIQRSSTVPRPEGGATTPAAPPPAESDPGDGSWSGIPSSPAEMDLTYCIRMARIFSAVAGGLAHAHARSIIHRDLKPSNLILDRSGSLRILDFGLARIEGQENLTATGEVVGTPRYMSPEQIRARQAIVDHRTDIYSLGATLFEVLTLRPPFEGSTVEITLRRILQDDPRPLRAINPRVPKDLETIVLKCLRKEPADRYASAEALARDLESFSRGDPIQARPQSLGEKLARRLRASRGKLAAAAAILLLLASVAFLYRKNQHDAQVLEGARYDDLVARSAAALQVSGSLMESLGIYCSEAAGYNIQEMGEGLDFSNTPVSEVAAGLERAIASAPQRPEAHYFLSRALHLIERKEDARRELGRAIDLGFVPAMALQSALLEAAGDAPAAGQLVERAAAAGQKDWMQARLAAHRSMAGWRWSEAQEAFGRLVDIEKATGERYPGSIVEHYVDWGIARLQLEEFEKARETFTRAGALRPEAAEPELCIGVSYYLEGREQEAEEAFDRLYSRQPKEHRDEVANSIIRIHCWRFQDHERAIAWADRLPPSLDRDLWRTTCLLFLKRNTEALEAAASMPERNPKATLAHLLPALAYLENGDFAQAEALARKAAELSPQSSGPLAMLSNIYHKQNKYMESFQAIRKAVEIEPRSAMPHIYLGFSYTGMGRFEDGVAEIEKGMELAGKRGSSPFFAVDMANYVLSVGLERLGKRDRALQALARAVEIGRAGDHPVADWVLALADLQKRDGRPAEAVRTLEEALDHPGTRLDEIPRIARGMDRAARELLPALPGYRSIEAALAEIDSRTLVAAGASWRFFRGKAAPAPGIEWTLPGFDDGAWETGASGFGYGDGDDATVLEDMADRYSSFYIRHAFTVEDPASIRKAILRIAVDDGCVAYLNGREVLRVRAPADAVLAFDAQALSEAPEPLEEDSVELDPRTAFQKGRNILAVIGLNKSASSSDFSLIPTLTAAVRPESARLAKLLEGFRASKTAPAAGAPAADPGFEGRLFYLQGRILEREGKPGEAIDQFLGAAARDASSPQPILALARCQRACGKPIEAEAQLRNFIERQVVPRREVWELWLAVALGDLRQEAREILTGLPCQKNPSPPRKIKADPSWKYCTDLEWAFTALQAGGPLRIRCGGKDWRDASGSLWGRDRFNLGGEIYFKGEREFTGDIAGTADDPIYQTERYFTSLERASSPGSPALEPGYHIPLPQARYRVTLHFAEIYRQPGAGRAFDVLLEGGAVLENYQPASAGFAAADRKSFELEVRDGFLDIEFRARTDYPKISAIEIQKL